MHLITLVETDPERHKLFRKWVREREYQLEGNLRSGPHSPYIREIRLYDINIKEKCLKKFLHDLNYWGDHGHVDDKKIKKIKKWISRLTPLKNIDDVRKEAGENKDPDFEDIGWLYAEVLGAIEDGKDKNGVEVL